MRLVVDRSKNSIHDCEGLTTLNINGFSFTTKKIHAKSRRIPSSFTMECSQDIKLMSGIDMKLQMINALQHELQQEIDREIIEEMVRMADAIHITHYDRVIHYV